MQRDPTKLADKEYDVAVIGGGIYGACVAWNAAQRGLSVALVERGDFAQETSANSLKTVHGGLRYLQDLDLKLVRTMIEERSTYLRIAPHLVQPLACITPTYSKVTKSKPVLGTALKLNDIVGYDRNKSLDVDRKIPTSQVLSREECFRVLPGLPAEDVTGAAIWHDAQIYDTERLTLAFVASAVNLGADACNYVEATGILLKRNQIVGVSARDIIADKNFEIRSKVVVNSTGPWVDRILESLDRVPGPPVFQPSLAVNMITRQLVDDYAAGVPSWLGESNSGGSNQPASHMLFVSPWRGNSIIGTFHTHFQGDPDNFSLQEQDLQEFIDEANSAYPGANLDLDDIKFVHFGFLPEVPNPKRTEVKLVRKSRIIDHHSDDGLSGLISVMGVKYTTARHTAENVVDMVFKKLGKRPTSGGSQNSRVYGGQIDNFGDFLASTVQKDSTNMTPETIDHWVRSYGTQYSTVKEQLTGTDERAPFSLLSEPVIRAQVIYAVQEEMAIKLADVILRRTGIGTIGQPDDPILRFIANTMALELDWSPEKVNLEIDEVKAFYRRHGISNLVVENLEKA